MPHAANRYNFNHIHLHPTSPNFQTSSSLLLLPPPSPSPILHHKLTMSYCPICAEKKLEKADAYEEGKYHGLGLLKHYDRKVVCTDCQDAVEEEELMVLHSQLPLPTIYHDKPKGVFTTRHYGIGEPIGPYTGKLITNMYEVYASDSIYIINRFYGNPPIEKRTFIDGACTGIFPFLLSFFFQLF